MLRSLEVIKFTLADTISSFQTFFLVDHSENFTLCAALSVLFKPLELMAGADLKFCPEGGASFQSYSKNFRIFLLTLSNFFPSSLKAHEYSMWTKFSAPQANVCRKKTTKHFLGFFERIEAKIAPPPPPPLKGTLASHNRFSCLKISPGTVF